MNTGKETITKKMEDERESRLQKQREIIAVKLSQEMEDQREITI
jgi:hypothetical protein